MVQSLPLLAIIEWNFYYYSSTIEAIVKFPHTHSFFSSYRKLRSRLLLKWIKIECALIYNMLNQNIWHKHQYIHQVVNFNCHLILTEGVLWHSLLLCTFCSFLEAFTKHLPQKWLFVVYIMNDATLSVGGWS
jgi:hypothetical protein